MIPRLFTTLAIFCILLALATLIPKADAAKECFFGYKALCPFTPGSTFILGMAAWIFHGMARKMRNRENKS